MYGNRGSIITEVGGRRLAQSMFGVYLPVNHEGRWRIFVRDSIEEPVANYVILTALAHHRLHAERAIWVWGEGFDPCRHAVEERAWALDFMRGAKNAG